MRFKKALMIGITRGKFYKEKQQEFEKLCEEIITLPKDSDEISNNLSDIDCLLVTLGFVVDREMIDKAPNLKYIGVYGTGYGRIDTEYASSKGIAVCNIAGYSTEGVAELAFAVLLEHIRDISRAKTQASNGEYSEASFKGTEISGKNFGIIGLGKIGARIAEIAANGFNANVIYYSRNRKTDKENGKVVYQENVKTLLQECDFVSLNLAYNNDTEKFLSEELIMAIKPNAILLNLSPMELIDFDALVKRLQANDITLIIDHSDELTAEQAKELSKYSNCILYPPIGYITEEAKLLMQKIFIDNMRSFLNGTPTNKVN